MRRPLLPIARVPFDRIWTFGILPDALDDRSGVSYLTEIGKREMMEGKVQRAEWFSGKPPECP